MHCAPASAGSSNRFPQYMDMLERNGVGLNVAAFAGHSAIRTFVMGEARRIAARRHR
jgi:N-acyl-D-aspartate/D-glutamate deacylase